ncbi:hypothetical protein FNV43_RR25551 [Rhamnella rubrinervis]|uniref:LRAT domain-containing protein n=1 Tax=Rhamnella rubrinervis TaxID=2594499 RepID=A0A8K0DUF7_9ROSA|nr:hypothetical protein FNV43_RR25551 [Rhamnella rubrinervis]
MGILSNKIEREKLRAGDHIYTWRSGYSYSHHGIYIGDEKVIHLTRGPGFLISSSSESQRSNDLVVCCNIEDFLGGGRLYRFEYGVNKIVFLINRPGTCSLASSNPPEQVLHRAFYLLEHGFSNYHLFGKNCEDFALYCKTGILHLHVDYGRSTQIASLICALGAVIIVPFGFLPSNLIFVALWFYVYCCLRYAYSIGCESFSEVVEVDKLQDHLKNAHENMEKLMKMDKRAKWSTLPRPRYYAYSAFAIRLWYWTPHSTILVWLRRVLGYVFLSLFVSDHLRLNGLKLGEYSAYTLWLLAYFYWRWTSKNTILSHKLLLWSRRCSSLVTSLLTEELTTIFSRLHEPTAFPMVESRDFDTHRPTGRFCNGRIPVDYLGDGKVIHLTRSGFIISSSLRSQQSKNTVVCCNIEDFLCDGELYRFEYGVSKVVFLKSRPGTCSLAPSDPPEQVLHRASYLLEHGFGNYDLMDKNCEDFALYCKTGIIKSYMTEGGISGQMTAFLAAFAAIAVIPYQYLPASLIGIALVVSGLYCVFRIQFDVRFKGRGIDPRIVAVENLDDVGPTTTIMGKNTMRWFLQNRVYYYMAYTLWVIRVWYWTPTNTILKWLKSDSLYCLLCIVVSDHLSLYGFKLGEYSAYTIWLLGYLWWRWSSIT